ncbi:nuclear transport factor 2 family protein [Pseudarthrobacter sp. YALA5]|uniref:ester cyclase n=1 Tax=Pseudarthrobacter sp. DSP2-3-2b1 TaxID=2804661 RepID=UPI001039D00D
MGQAREVMDRITAAMNAKDKDMMARCYADEAVLVTPDRGEITGRDKITSYLFQQWDAMPDVHYESVRQYESGNTAIDEGIVTGTNTGELKLASGQSLAPTGKKIRVQSCDVGRVEDGACVYHRFYFDQLEFMAQVGMLPESMTQQLSSH